MLTVQIKKKDINIRPWPYKRGKAVLLLQICVHILLSE